MAKKDCPYCGGKETFFVAGSTIEVACEYCVKGHIPKIGETRIGLLERITNFFNGD